MKIENNGINPLSPNKMQPANGTEKKTASQGMSSIVGGQDRAELSENARMLAKARASMDEGDDLNAERVAQLRQQVQNGDYTVQVEEIARRLMTGIFSK